MKAKLLKLSSLVLCIALQFLGLGTASAQVIDNAEGYPQAVLTYVESWNESRPVPELRPSTYIEIDQLAFYANIRLIKTQILNNSTRLMVVIKSDAYGHGLELLAGVAEMAGADYFGITENSSLLTIQRLELSSPIVRLRLASNDELVAVHSDRELYGDVEEMVGNLQMVELLSRLGEQTGQKIKVHLNLNTGGMFRNGFDMNVLEIREQILSLITLPSIEVAGIMTHFPNADAEDISGTRLAFEEFKDQADWIIENGKLNRDVILLHVANTSTSLRLPEAHLDMVRIGSLAFGEKL